MIPASRLFDQFTLLALLDHDPVIQDYRTFFSLLDWSVVREWQHQRSSRGRPSIHPVTAYLKAFLLRIREGLLYATQLRRFLLNHPLLIIEFGFHLVLDPDAPYGFDPEQTLPCRFWFSEKLRTLDSSLLQRLLAATVPALSSEIPGLGETVAFDVKHMYAWVKENNKRVSVENRYDKHQILAGDPDARLGVKRRSNKKQDEKDDEKDTESPEQTEMLWGYSSGVAAATVPGYGDVVLAEYTQTFNKGDVTYFRPLFEQTTQALHTKPRNITADAAFDAWYVYDSVAQHGGMAAVPLNEHGHKKARYDSDAVPLCEKGLRMTPSFQFAHNLGYRARRFLCPLLHPHITGHTCDHEQFLKGIGCRKQPNWEAGGRIRVTLDRESPLYKAVYAQRTACERIFSQAKELGMERPRVHNRRSVTNLNTLISIVMNVRTLQRARKANQQLLLLN